MSATERLVNLLRELEVPVRFGLEAQGHLPTVNAMIAEGKSWEAIGAVIGWNPSTAQKYFEAVQRERVEQRDHDELQKVLSDRSWIYCIERLPESTGRYDVSTWRLQTGEGLVTARSTSYWDGKSWETVPLDSSRVYAWKESPTEHAPLRKRDLRRHLLPAGCMDGLAP